jgi:uroporphyrinogen decarboxylase
MDSVERVQCVLAGRRPDRPPVSFWHHFPPRQVFGAPAVQAHLEYVERYGLDFLKIMNDNGYPHVGPVQTVRDLESIGELRGDEPEFGRQLELIAALHTALRGRMLMTTTVFNAWSVLRRLVRPPKEHRPPQMEGAADEPSQRIKAFYAEDPAAGEAALGRIAANLARFAVQCLAAGADGIFLSVRDDWVDEPDAAVSLYGELVRPTDLKILGAASVGRFNILHVCGRSVRFRSFADYPVHVLNWADRAAGPAIRDVATWLRPAVCAGLDNLGTLVSGQPEDCAREVRDALHQAGARPIIMAPGCTFDPARVPQANLEAVCRAVCAAPNLPVSR